MKNLTSVIKVKVATKDKEEATNILNELGLDMNTFVNMAIKQLIKADGLPFKVSNLKPNKGLLKSLEEGERIIQEVKEGKRKGYNNVNEMLKAILDN